MTKKHFIAFAKEAKQYSDLAATTKDDAQKASFTLRAQAIHDAVTKVQDNPNFDYQKFRTACGL